MHQKKLIRKKKGLGPTEALSAFFLRYLLIYVFMCLYIHTHRNIHTCVCIFIYERERERELSNQPRLIDQG